MDDKAKQLITGWDKETDHEKHKDINIFIDKLKDQIGDQANERFRSELNKIMITTEIQMMEYKKVKKNIHLLNFEQNLNKKIKKILKKYIKNKNIEGRKI